VTLEAEVSAAGAPAPFPARPVDMTAARSLKLTESMTVRRAVIGVSVVFILIFVCVPLTLVFVKAFEKGVAAYVASITEPDALSAVRLTLLTAAIVVPGNTLFGLAAAWAIAKFTFRGKSVLTTFIDLPFTVSPVIAGMVFVLLFGMQGWLGGWLDERHIRIIFAPAGIILATMFVTFPFVARELIPVMQMQGTEEEQAAIVLGAGGWRTFVHVTFPNIRWALLYGVILCNARAMGEFGAVSVVSGHIRGATNTIPLHAEILYNEYHMNAAFAVASLLALLAVVTLVVKKLAELHVKEELAASGYLVRNRNEH
jgi:sulfate/thiosulfate transport system permease protein